MNGILFCLKIFLNSIDIPISKVILKKFKRNFLVNFMKYYTNTWLENWKKKVVSAQVDPWLYFNNNIILKIEGYYVKMKEYLDFFNRDLKYVYKNLELYQTK